MKERFKSKQEAHKEQTTNFEKQEKKIFCQVEWEIFGKIKERQKKKLQKVKTTAREKNQAEDLGMVMKNRSEKSAWGLNMLGISKMFFWTNVSRHNGRFLII